MPVSVRPGILTAVRRMARAEVAKSRQSSKGALLRSPQKLVQEKRHPGATGLKLELLSWLVLFSRKTWKRTAVGAGVGFSQQFSGIIAFIYYAPTLFQALGQFSEQSLILSGVFNILQMVTAIVYFLIIDKVGRTALAIFGGFVCAAAYFIMAVLSGLYSSDWKDQKSVV